MSAAENSPEFVPTHDSPIPYINRIHTWYSTFGYKPYRWAQHKVVPFTPLSKPLAQSKVVLITTAAPYQPDKGDQGPGAPYNAAAKFYEVYSDSTESIPDLRISHIGIDRKHTTAEDQRSWFPLQAARKALEAGRFAELGSRFHGMPTNRSHRVTLSQDCPELLRRVQEDGADVAVLLAA